MKIKGRVFDATNDEPLQDASVVLMDKATTTKTGTRTSSDGSFTLDSPLLDDLYCKVAISYVGYETLLLSPSGANADIYLGRGSDATGGELPTVTVWATLKKKKREFLVFALSVIIASLLIVYISKMPSIQKL